MICNVGKFHLYEENPFYEKFVGVVELLYIASLDHKF